MKNLIAWIAGRILALLGWILAGLFWLVDRVTEMKQAAEYTPEAPFPGPVVQDKALAERLDTAEDLAERRRKWAERMDWEREVYEEIDEMIGEGDPHA